MPASVTLVITGVVSHMPPVGPLGSRSTSVTFQASESPEFTTSIVNCPVSPRFMVAGPDLSTISSGAAIVSGGLMPHSPGSGSKNSSSIIRPKSHLAVLTNCVPIAFAGTSSSTAVSSITS